MPSETNSSKIWIKFESKRKNGEVIKLRIQDLPSNRKGDFVTFFMSYAVKDEPIHKAAGVATNTDAVEEYNKLLSSPIKVKSCQIAVCCLDDDLDVFGEILAVSIVHITVNGFEIEHAFNKKTMKFQTKEMQAMTHILRAMQPKFPKSVKEKYESYHEGRGIIVHPDYRGLGIANQIVKQRRLLIQEYKVPMTCAWMTSMGSQKAAERDGWETVVEFSLEELDQLTGCFFVKDVPTFKLMVATLDS